MDAAAYVTSPKEWLGLKEDDRVWKPIDPENNTDKDHHQSARLRTFITP